MGRKESLFPLVYVDLDDVLCETIRAFTDVLRRSFGKSVQFEDVFSFNLGKSFGLGPKELEEFMILAHQPFVLASIEPIKGAVEVLTEWKNNGIHITVVTGRPVSSFDVSKEWLQMNKIPFDSFIVVDKYGHDQGDSARKPLGLRRVLRSDFYLAIEDSPRMSRFLAQHVGVPILLNDRPWNQKIERLPKDLERLVIRCRNWMEIGNAFNSLAKK